MWQTWDLQLHDFCANWIHWHVIWLKAPQQLRYWSGGKIVFLTTQLVCHQTFDWETVIKAAEVLVMVSWVKRSKNKKVSLGSLGYFYITQTCLFHFLFISFFVCCLASWTFVQYERIQMTRLCLMKWSSAETVIHELPESAFYMNQG